MELLLLSNSTNYGETMFAHAVEQLVPLVAGDIVTFVPYALADWEDYAERVTAALEALGLEVRSAHHSSDPARSILDAEVILMGGGNSFRLLDSLIGLGVVGTLAENVRERATRYVGSSAGTNMASPSIRTTNDMPICRPSTFESLGLVPFQVNLHYADPDPDTIFMGESRDERIHEFLEENDCPVLAMYEGSMLRVSGERAAMHGPARLFERERVHDLRDGDDVTPLLQTSPSFDRGVRPRPAVG